MPLAAACSSNMRTICCRLSRRRIGAGSSVSLPPSMRAMSSVPSISDSRWSPPRRITRTACWRCAGHRGVLVEQLRVAEDAVQRRAQLVADGRDVAALGLVGAHRRRAWRCCSASSVRWCDSISCTSRCGLAVRFFLRHLRGSCASAPATRRPCRADEQQRRVGLDEAELQRRPRRRRDVAPSARQLVLVEQRRTGRPAAARQRHQQQVVAEPGVELRPQRARQRRRAAPRATAPPGARAACTGRGSARRASSTASRCRPGRPGSAPCRRAS